MKSLINLLPEKYKVYLLPGVLVTVIFIISIYFVFPTTKGIFEKQKELETKQEQLNKLKKKRVLLQSLDRNVVLSNLKDIRIALPEEKDAASIFISLENLTQDRQLGIDAMSLSPGVVSTDSAKKDKTTATPAIQVKTRKGVDSLPVNTQVRGSTQQIIDLVNGIHTSRRIFDIENVSLKYFPDSEDFLGAELVLHTYFLAPITQIGSVESPIVEITANEKALLAQIASFPDVSSLRTTENEQLVSQQVGKTDLFAP